MINPLPRRPSKSWMERPLIWQLQSCCSWLNSSLFQGHSSLFTGCRTGYIWGADALRVSWASCRSSLLGWLPDLQVICISRKYAFASLSCASILMNWVWGLSCPHGTFHAHVLTLSWFDASLSTGGEYFLEHIGYGVCSLDFHSGPTLLLQHSCLDTSLRWWHMS